MDRFCLLMLVAAIMGLGACAAIPSDPVRSLSDGRSGRIWFATGTMRFSTFLQGGAAAPEAMISGSLRLPKGSGRGAAVVLVHGLGGVSSNNRRWASTLSKAGYVTFLLDPDNRRSIGEVATHPRFDPNRVALMGFSKGGIVAALYSALNRFYTLNGTPGLRYAAHLPFYPSCHSEFRDLGAISTLPIRIFHGGGDDWTPAEPCLNLVKA